MLSPMAGSLRHPSLGSFDIQSLLKQPSFSAFQLPPQAVRLPSDSAVILSAALHPRTSCEVQHHDVVGRCHCEQQP